jgi:nicotinamidase-related amidase
MANLCAVVVDMQPYFTEDVETLELLRMIHAQRQTLRFFRDNELPIVVFEFTPRRFGGTIREIESVLEGYSSVARISKNEPNGFFYTKADEVLEGLGATELTFMGVNASCCVPATAVGAIKDGKRQMNTARQLVADGVDVTMKLNVPEWYGSRGIYKDSCNNLLFYLENLRSGTLPSMPSRKLQQV